MTETTFDAFLGSVRILASNPKQKSSPWPPCLVPCSKSYVYVTLNGIFKGLVVL